MERDLFSATFVPFDASNVNLIGVGQIVIALEQREKDFVFPVCRSVCRYTARNVQSSWNFEVGFCAHRGKLVRQLFCDQLID